LFVTTEPKQDVVVVFCYICFTCLYRHDNANDVTLTILGQLGKTYIYCILAPELTTVNELFSCFIVVDLKAIVMLK